MAVCLDALEDLLAVVQNCRGRVHHDWAVRDYLGGVPTLVLLPDHNHLVVGELCTKDRVCENRIALALWSWVWVSGYLKVHNRHLDKFQDALSNLIGRTL